MRACRRTLAAGALVLLAGCQTPSQANRGSVTLRFWAFGHEGEVVEAMMPAFERAHPGVHVRVEQIPFTAAHEKLLTAVVGDAAPDLAQLGNTWVPELATLHALEPLDSLIAASGRVDRTDYFPGIWATNVVHDTTYGVPWYVDTRVLFYRSDLLDDVGYHQPPRTWSSWYDAMRRLREREGHGHYGVLLPVNEWAQPVILAMGAGAPLLRDGDRYGDFQDPRFAAAFGFYVRLFHDSLAPSVSNTEIENLYHSFGSGDVAMFISGPWDVGECLRRLPPAVQGHWMTAPIPAPDPVPGIPATAITASGGDTAAPGTSLAGGSSLVVFRGSPHAHEAWELVEYLSQPSQEAAFYHLAQDLPPRRSAWRDSAIASNPYMAAFARQLTHVEPTPKIPEWDQITTLITDHGEAAARNAVSVESALAALNADADRLLAKRRWVLGRARTLATTD